MPRHITQSADDELEICAFFEQKNISRKNTKRLVKLQSSNDPNVEALASAVLAVARVKPHKRRRLKFLARYHPQILDALAEVDLILPQAEYHAMKYGDDNFERGQNLQLLFDRDMDEYRLSGNDVVLGDVESLLFEYTAMMDSET